MTGCDRSGRKTSRSWGSYVEEEEGPDRSSFGPEEYYLCGFYVGGGGDFYLWEVEATY